MKQIIFVIVFILMLVLSTAFGGVSVPLLDTFFILLDQLPIINIADLNSMYQTIILEIRLPRVLVAALVGAALAISGTVMQGVFRNPMADPGIIGVSTGGAFGAVIAIFFGLASIHYLVVPIMGFMTACITLFVVYFIATNRGKTSIATLLLTGIAVSAFLSSMISLTISFANYSAMQQIVYWLMGDLNAKSWNHFAMLIVPVLFGICLFIIYAKDLDILLLGEEQAQNMGISVQRTRTILLVIASLLTGISVALTGSIGFVGLIVPHMMRLIIGPVHRYLIPASALGGAIFLMAADLLSRIVIRPAEIQVGIVTAFFGAPFFIYLILRNKKKGELT